MSDAVEVCDDSRLSGSSKVTHPVLCIIDGQQISVVKVLRYHTIELICDIVCCLIAIIARMNGIETRLVPRPIPFIFQFSKDNVIDRELHGFTSHKLLFTCHCQCYLSLKKNQWRNSALIEQHYKRIQVNKLTSRFLIWWNKTLSTLVIRLA